MLGFRPPSSHLTAAPELEGSGAGHVGTPKKPERSAALSERCKFVTNKQKRLRLGLLRSQVRMDPLSVEPWVS